MAPQFIFTMQDVRKVHPPNKEVIKGLWKGKGLTGGLVDFFETGPYELLANSLIMFVAFIPFFGVKELGRVLGQERIGGLFFRRRADQGIE